MVTAVHSPPRDRIIRLTTNDVTVVDGRSVGVAAAAAFVAGHDAASLPTSINSTQLPLSPASASRWYSGTRSLGWGGLRSPPAAARNGRGLHRYAPTTPKLSTG